MKKALLFLVVLFIIFFSFYGRYQPVSLDLVKPDLKDVEIKGEVNVPVIYTVKWEATVQDVIDEAGGLTEQADVSSISLIEEVLPDTVILIPGMAQTQGLISINEASLEQLDTLPGIGPAIAQRIIDYRNEHPFTSLEEIKEVKGIGDKSYEKIKALICL